MTAPVLMWFGLDDVRKGTIHLQSDMTHDEEVRERDELRFVCLERPEKYDRLVWWDEPDGAWREHVVRETWAAGDGLCEVAADGALFETRCDFLEACRIERVSYYDLLKWLVPYTRFSVGSYGFGGVNEETTWLTRMSFLDGLRRLEKLYQVEFYLEIDVDEETGRVSERRLSFCAEQGAWRGLRLVHGKNLPIGCLQVKSDDVITAMYGFGISFGAYDDDGNPTGGFTRRLSFGEVNGGVDYVADERALELYGRKNPDGSRRHNFGYTIFENEQRAERLYTKTHEALQKANAPKIAYVVDEPIDVSGRDVRLGDVALVVSEVSGAPYRCGMRVVERTRRFGREVRQSIRLGDITAGTRSHFAAYERRCGSITTVVDALVAAGLREPDANAAVGALSIAVELRNAKRTDGTDIDLRYTFDLAADDVYRFDVAVANNLDHPIYDVQVEIPKAGVSETLFYLTAKGSKLYSFAVSPSGGDVASGAFVCAAEASCPERFTGTSQFYEACEVTGSVGLPLSSTEKPVDTIPDDLSGDGSFAVPYTVADLRRCHCVSTTEAAIDEVWVCGYVVGWADMGVGNRFNASSLQLGASDAGASNIVLADTPDETDVARMVPVNLSTATRRRKAVRAALNLADNPQMVGTRVWVLGDVMRYGAETGVRNTDEHRYCDASGKWHGWWTVNGQLGEDLKG